MKKKEYSLNREKTLKLIVQRLKKHGAKKVLLFGSYARGEEKKTSDIDLIVDLPKKLSLLDIVHIERELSEGCKKKIDLLTPKAIHPLLKSRIKKESIILYRK